MNFLQFVLTAKYYIKLGFWFSKTKILVNEFSSIRFYCQMLYEIRFLVLEDKNIGEGIFLNSF